jgi:hypothetical protein
MAPNQNALCTGRPFSVIARISNSHIKYRSSLFGMLRSIQPSLSLTLGFDVIRRPDIFCRFLLAAGAVMRLFFWRKFSCVFHPFLPR